MTQSGFGKLKIDDLERAWNQSGCDRDVGKEILSTLEVRKDRARNRALRKAIEDGVQVAEGAPVSRGDTSTPPLEPPFDAEPDRPIDEILAEKYELLRCQLSSEGEILSRWGMTPSLPEDIRAAVFDLWRARLASTAPGIWRTARMLEADVAELTGESRKPE